MTSSNDKVPTVETSDSTKRAGIWSRLYNGETDFDIVGRWKVWFIGSSVAILIGVVSVVGSGLNLGIDFTGGTVWEVAAGKAEVADVSAAMTDLGYQDAQVQEVTQNSGGDTKRFLRVEAATEVEPDPATTAALKKARRGIDGLVDDAPPAVRGDLRGIRDDLSGVTGPFATPVPAPLKELQAELDALPAKVSEAKGTSAKTVVYRTALAPMTKAVEDLVDLEAQERARLSQDVTEMLTKQTGTPEAEVTIDTVGPSWGRQISEKARSALVVFLAAITVFITIRFELKMAIATVVALFHDLIVVVGLYSLFNFPVLDLRRDRGLRPGRREHRSRVGIEGQDDLLRDGQRVSQPGAHAVSEHLDNDPSADPVGTGGRVCRPRRLDPRGVRDCIVPGADVGCLLVAVHRHPAARPPQGTRAPLPGTAQERAGSEGGR